MNANTDDEWLQEFSKTYSSATSIENIDEKALRRWQTAVLKTHGTTLKRDMNADVWGHSDASLQVAREILHDYLPAELKHCEAAQILIPELLNAILITKRSKPVRPPAP